MSEQQILQNADAEFEAMYAIHEALEPLHPKAKARVLGYFIARFNVDPAALEPWMRAYKAEGGAAE